MEAPVIVWFTKATLGIIVAFIVYATTHRNTKNFSVARLFILSSIALAIALPSVGISGYNLFNGSITSLITAGIESVTIKASPAESIDSLSSHGISAFHFAGLAYLLICTILLIRLIVQLIRIGALYFKGDHVYLNGNRIVLHTRNLGPFSFINTIFINPGKISETQLNHIVSHERSHIMLAHSADTLFMELITIFFWFNPAIWYLRRQLTEIHEFQADSHAIAHCADLRLYSETILEVSFGQHLTSLMTGLNKSLTLKRLALINGRSSRKREWVLLPILGLVVCVGLIFLISCEHEKTEEQQVTVLKSMTEPEEVFYVVEDMPKFQGAETNTFRQYIADNLRYPAEAAAKGIQGRVFVQFTVDTKGNVKDINVLKSPDESLSREAIRVVAQSDGLWTPGRQRGIEVNVSFTFPIIFVLQ
jgi:TonB family protein